MKRFRVVDCEFERLLVEACGGGAACGNAERAGGAGIGFAHAASGGSLRRRSNTTWRGAWSSSQAVLLTDGRMISSQAHNGDLAFCVAIEAGSF